MINRNKVLSGMLITTVTIALLPLARPAYGQAANSQVIHMANLLANMQKTIDAKKAKPGETFTAKTVTPATLNDGTVIPLDSILEGHVDSATPSEHHGDSTLVVTIDKLQLKGGKEITVKAIVVKVSSLLPVFGGEGQPDDQHFDRPSGSAPMMPSQHRDVSSTGSSTGPHPVEGLSVTSSIAGSDSGTFTQKKRNVHLSNENQFEVSLAVVPAGVILQ
jgi:hypothetical protein